MTIKNATNRNWEEQIPLNVSSLIFVLQFTSVLRWLFLSSLTSPPGPALRASTTRLPSNWRFLWFSLSGSTTSYFQIYKIVVETIRIYSIGLNPIQCMSMSQSRIRRLLAQRQPPCDFCLHSHVLPLLTSACCCC